MERGKSFVYIDTHIVLWLYDALLEKLTPKAKTTLNSHDVVISSFVKLEMQFLFEVGKISVKPATILDSLSRSIGLQIIRCDQTATIQTALDFSWTRNPFDRLIAAEAKTNDTFLVSADRNIAQNCDFVIW